MKLSETLIALVIVSGVMVGLGTAVSSLGANYGRTETFDYASFDQTTDIRESAESLQAKLGSSTGFNPLIVFDLLNFLFFNFVGIFLAIPNMISDIIYLASGELGVLVPEWLITIGIVATIVFVVAKVASIAAKREI